MSTILKLNWIHKAKEILSVDEEIIIQAIRELSKEKELFLEETSILTVILEPLFLPLSMWQKREWLRG